MTRHSRRRHHLIGIVGAVALAASALVFTATPAAAAGCPVVNPTTHVVTPAPAPDTKWQGCNLTNADLTYADLTNSNLSTANLNGADLFGATLNGVNFAGAVLSNANLAATTLTGADLTGATMNAVNLNGADLDGATLTGVSSGDVLGTPAALPSPWKLAKGYLVGPGAQLLSAELDGAALSGADASGANLKNASLGSVDFTGAALVGANLENAYLGFANLNGADLSQTILTETNVQFADFTGVLLSGVTSGDVDGSPFNLPVGWMLENGYFLGFQANLAGALLEGQDLTGVDLFDADLTGAYLQNAILTNARLRKTRLANAKLDGVVSGGITGTPYSLPYGWTLVGGFLIPPPSYLRVTTSPAVSSQISIDGAIADSWGLRWVEVPEGAHQVCFGAVPGFITPPCETVFNTALATTTVTGTFTPRGYLRAITSPAVASQITVDGERRDNWGMWTEFATGSHQVCFGAVKGFIPPACQTVTVTAGATTTVTGTFVASAAAPAQSGVGFLRATTSPPVPSLISVDGAVADTWGLSWMELATGFHEVCFQRVEGYSTPSCQTVNVSAGATTTVTGTFAQRAFLKVETNPPVAGTISINGKPADAWGVYTDVAPGAYEVCFGKVTGKVAPACQNALVTAGVQSTIVGTYTTAP